MVHKSWFISQRSGMKFDRKGLIKEPLTGLLIHRSESDGYYELEERHRRRQLQFNDPIPLAITRPDRDWTVDLYLEDSLGNFITDSLGNRLEVP